MPSCPTRLSAPGAIRDRCAGVPGSLGFQEELADFDESPFLVSRTHTAGPFFGGEAAGGAILESMFRCAIILLTFIWPVLAADSSFRPPAVPLAACDPYFSVWSASDNLAGDVTRHWTGTPQALTSLARIDGKAMRLMGAEPRGVPAMRQVSLEALPTRSIYVFEDSGVRLTLTFTTPMLPRDLEVLSWPVTYLTWTAVGTDGRPHSAAVYFDASPALATNTPEQDVVWSR